MELMESRHDGRARAVLLENLWTTEWIAGQWCSRPWQLQVYSAAATPMASPQALSSSCSSLWAPSSSTRTGRSITLASSFSHGHTTFHKSYASRFYRSAAKKNAYLEPEHFRCLLAPISSPTSSPPIFGTSSLSMTTVPKLATYPLQIA